MVCWSLDGQELTITAGDILGFQYLSLRGREKL